MRRLCSIVAFLLVLTALTVCFGVSVKSSNGTVLRAVLVAGNGAQKEKNDVNDLYKILSAGKNWKKGNIKRVINKSWTDVKKTINTFLVANADADDVSLFFVTAHANFRDDDDNDENQGGALDSPDEALVVKGEKIYDDDFWAAFVNIKGQIIFIFSVCYSGGLFQSAAHQGGSSDLAINNSIVFSACSESEKSYGDNTLEHWAFPYFLAKGLSSQFKTGPNKGYVLADTVAPLGKVTAKEWYDYASPATSKYEQDEWGDTQTPQFDDVAYADTFVSAANRVVFEYDKGFTSPITLNQDESGNTPAQHTHCAGECDEAVPLSIRVPYDPYTLDPRYIYRSASEIEITNAVFDQLVSFNPETLEVSPYIADSWEVSSDGCEITFHLNEGITFHNGDPLTAHDVAFTFNWIANPENNSPKYWELEWLAEAIVLDDYTLQLVEKQEYCPFAPALIHAAQAIVPKGTVIEMGDEAFGYTPIGSGPFKFVEWVRGDHITLERNEDYWLTTPFEHQVIFKILPEVAATFALEAEDIHVTDSVPPEDVERLQYNPQLQVLGVPGLNYYYIGFDMSKAPYNDVRFRKAVYMSFSIDEAIQRLFPYGTAIRAYGAVPPELWANDAEYLQENIALWENHEAADALFEELRDEGVLPPYFSTTICSCVDDADACRLAEIVTDGLSADGIEANLQVVPWPHFVDLLQRGDCDIYINGLKGGPDPDEFLYTLFHSERARISNFSLYINPLVDDLLQQARATLDPYQREGYYIEAQRIIFSNYVHIPAYHRMEMLFSSAQVRNLQPDPRGCLTIVDPYNNTCVGNRTKP